MLRRVRAVVVAAVVAVGAACAGGGTPAGERAEQEGRDGAAVAVASFDFAESRLLAELYAQALEAAGFPVDRQLALGPRELVVPALRQGFVDVVPEYAGSAEELLTGGGVVAGTPAAAANVNVVAVTSAFAEEHGVAAVSDLRPISPALTLGGPSECPERRYCLAGLRDVYGLRFAAFVPLDGADLVHRALADGVIDAGVLFSTDPALADPGLVALADDAGLQPDDHVVPVVREEVADRRLLAALDAVSARLTTGSLRLLNWRLANAGTTVADEARAWLVRHGLLDR